MTHTAETGAINRFHFSDGDLWYVCHANLGPDSSGTTFRQRLEHCSIPSQKVACTWLKWWMTYDRFSLQSCIHGCYLFVYLFYFISATFSTKNWLQQMESTYGAGFCSICRRPNSIKALSDGNMMFTCCRRCCCLLERRLTPRSTPVHTGHCWAGREKRNVS